VENTHRRLFPYRPEEIHRWLLAAWSGGPDDVFPRDLIRTWRRNPAELPAEAFVAGVTRIGHGPFAFLVREVNATGWQVDVVGRNGLQHGFAMVAAPGGTLLTHRIHGPLRGGMRIAWPLVIEPLHDWVVEALFDRLEVALATGTVPATTTRPMRLRERTLLRLVTWLLPRRRASSMRRSPAGAR
jgi:hypothetical protein